MERTDENLMAAYADGDEAALEEIFSRYAALLWRVMRRQLMREEDAGDLVQETFLNLHRAKKDYRRGAPLRSWLMTIAMNLKREYFRRSSRAYRKSFG